MTSLDKILINTSEWILPPKCIVIIPFVSAELWRYRENHSGNSTGNVPPVLDGDEGMSPKPSLHSQVWVTQYRKARRDQEEDPGWYFKCDSHGVAGKTHSKYTFLTPLAENKGRQSNLFQSQREIPNNQKMVGAKSLLSETRRIWLPGWKQSPPPVQKQKRDTRAAPCHGWGRGEAPENPPSAPSFSTRPRFSLQKAAEATASGDVSSLQ